MLQFSDVKSRVSSEAETNVKSTNNSSFKAVLCVVYLFNFSFNVINKYIIFVNARTIFLFNGQLCSPYVKLILRKALSGSHLTLYVKKQQRYTHPTVSIWASPSHCLQLVASIHCLYCNGLLAHNEISDIWFLISVYVFCFPAMKLLENSRFEALSSQLCVETGNAHILGRCELWK